jgi:hypothetical protein
MPVFLKDIRDRLIKLENDNINSFFWNSGYGEPTDGTVVVALKHAVGARKIDELLPVFRDPLQNVPTTRLTISLVVGDSLADELMSFRPFIKENIHLDNLAEITSKC